MRKTFSFTLVLFTVSILSIVLQAMFSSSNTSVLQVQAQPSKFKKIDRAASRILWVNWLRATVGSHGSAFGKITTASPIKVSYRGEVFGNTVTNGSFQGWNPASTFSGGNVANPPTHGDIIALAGGSTQVNKITFSAPVQNPVLAIWSLGQPGFNAKFVFPTQPFSIQSGGPNINFGGDTITSIGNTVNGQEGNGTIQFPGTYSTITWRNPIQEVWYAFTVGVPDPSL